MQVIFKSFNSNIILLFIEKRLKPLLKLLGVSGLSIINLPTQKKKYTMNRSPHVFSKSKEQFELKYYTKLVNIPLKKGSVVNFVKFEKLLMSNIVNGLSIKVKN